MYNRYNLMATVLVFVCLSIKVSANQEIQQLIKSYHVASADEHLMQTKEADLEKTPYSVQVASYMNEADAVAHVNEIKSKDKSVFYNPSFVRGQVWFKVYVGKFENKNSAEDFRKQFIKKFDEPFAVVVSLLDRPGADERMPASDNNSKLSAENKKAIAKADDIMPAKSTLVEKVAPMVKAETKTETKAKSAIAAKVESKVKADLAEPIMPAPKPVSKTKINDAGKMEVEKKTTVPEKIEVAVKPKDAPQIVTTPKMVADKNKPYFSVQVGAYPSEELAKAELKKLYDGGYSTFTETAEVKGKTWYRVFIGRFDSAEEAEKYRNTIAGVINKKDSFIRKMTAN